MILTQYKTSSNPTEVTKELTKIGAITGVIVSPCSITDPVITVKGLSLDCNYLYIDAFKRYYFVNNITVEDTGMFTLSCHVDVLQSYATGIKSNSAIVSRQESKYNLLLNDGLFRTTQNPRIAQFNFPRGFEQLNYVIALAGGGASA